MNITFTRLARSLGLVALMASAPAFAGNMIVNGTFDANTGAAPDSWTLVAPADAFTWAGPKLGNCLGGVGNCFYVQSIGTGQWVSLSQTVKSAVGKALTLSFSYNVEHDLSPGEVLQVLINDVSVFSGQTAPQVAVPSGATQSWSRANLPFVSTGHDTITFLFSNHQALSIDSVSVAATK